MTRADFLAGESNAQAIALIDRWPDWPSTPVMIVGPAGSGKSHLAAIWREASGASVADANAVRETDVERLAATGSAVEDLHSGPLDEAALFHLVNRARESGTRLLFTSQTPPSALGLRLPDLASRLRAAHVVGLGAPEDALLRRVLVKLFADRQLVVDRAVIDYLTVRMERSLGSAAAVVEALDHAALAAGKGVTRRLAADVLGDHGAADADEI